MTSGLDSTTLPPGQVSRRPKLSFGLAMCLLFLMLALVGALLFYLVYTVNNLAAAPDFYVQWYGTKVVLQGGNPYSAQTMLETQLYLRGAPAPPQDDQLVFVYPLYSVLLSAPLAGLPYQWAAAVWMGVLLAGNCVGTLLLLAALDWRLPGLPKLAIFGLVLLSAPFAACVLLGQMAAAVYALLCLVLWAIRRQYYALAGVALALATVKPTLVLLVVAGCMLWGLGRRHWPLLIAFGLTLGLLLLGSLAWQGGWLAEFSRVTSFYTSYKKVLTGPSFFFEGWPGGEILGWLGWLILAGGLAYCWYNTLRGSLNFSFAFALTLLMTLLLLPQTNLVNALILLPPLLMVLRFLAIPKWLWLVLPTGLIIGSWLLYLLVFKAAYGWSVISLPFLLLPFLGYTGLKLLRLKT